MNKFYMNGKLIHKASEHNTKRCEVEKQEYDKAYSGKREVSWY